MAISTKQKYLKHLSLVFADGAASPTTLTVPHTRGDTKLSGLTPKVLNKTVKTIARGELIGAGKGERGFPVFSLSAYITCFKAAAAPGPVIAYVLGSADPYTALVSTLAIGDEDMQTINIQVTEKGLILGDTADHTYTLHDCDLTSCDWAEGEEGMFVDLSFEVLGEIDGDISLAQHEAA